MKIADLKTYVLKSRLSETFGYSQYWYDHRTAMLLEVITDEGIIGWGEAYGPAEPISSIIQHFLKPVVIGEDPLDIERVWEKLYNRSRDFGQKGMPIAAISAVDIALWDILGKTVGLPVHKLLGGCLRDRIVAYATGLYFRKREDLPLALADEARKYVGEGFTAKHPIVQKGGDVEVPKGPGLGIEIDRDVMRRYLVSG